ncbi:aminotransferase class III-fold pyridoxal phosphate-dependent enzyme [Massilia atriviolacea]|uniref:Aminotransferase class III-fold pyridoxal phosphate-dependent enzyme n=1 Tax=Massilia atriviolacea TaxID=2495579 RepID=A0A430HU37_9BURK|nr:aminotransferase class III-fold pyridoxal phosphate-dependent enzyme [Massilia atriviolacea]RSZ60894.1 aminotransferase class III-fold pyridoxal phosphate-dependent enzyme [Massilia atriviolacea]
MNPQPNTAAPPSTDYATYCQPRLTEMMGIVGLDKHYFQGEGSRIRYRGADGAEREVIDFLGGYGSTLLGHNHPELIRHAIANLQGNMVHHGQLSVRAHAGQLGRRLSEHLHAATGRRFMVLQANSGAEAVELALKAAEFAKRARISQALKRIETELYASSCAAQAGKRLRAGDLEAIRALVAGGGDASPAELFGALERYNRRAAAARPMLLGLRRGFHGKTTGALQLTHNEAYRAPFERLGTPVRFLDPGDLAAADEAIADSEVSLYSVTDSAGELRLSKSAFSNIAAFFAEPIQGEGGIHPLDAGYLQRIRERADRHDFPLVLDEIQTGMGRTGTLFYAEQLGVRGDFYLLGKSLGGALAKISAIMVDEQWYEPDFGLLHSSTFAEDDYSSSMACRVLDVMASEGILQQCADKGRLLGVMLRELQQRYPDVIREVRGVGLLIGLEFVPREDGSPTLRDIFMEGRLGYIIAGYLLNKHGIRVAPTLSSPATIRLEPSALIGPDECRRLLDALALVCEILRRQNAYELTNYIVGSQAPKALDQIADCRPLFPARGSGSGSWAAAPGKIQRKVAFLGHLSTISNLRHWDPSLAQLSDEEAAAWLRILSPMVGPLVHKSEVIESITGERVLLEFITLYFDSEMISEQVKAGKQDAIKDRIQRAVDFATERGCEAIGFGGYSSIVTGNCKRVQLRQNVALTTGNSLTVAMGVQALLDSAAEQGVDLEQSCFAAVGAAGNIASIYAELMANRVPRLLLIGTAGSRKRVEQVARHIYASAFADLTAKMAAGEAAALAGVAGALVAHPCTLRLLALPAGERPADIGAWLFDAVAAGEKEAPIRISEELADLRSANLILSASSTPAALIYPHHIGSGPVVICDIAVPLDVHPSVHAQCPNVLTIQGGLVRLPQESAYTIPGMPLEPGLAFACNAETILMGLANMTSHYSYGKITKGQVEEISRLARQHGLTLARPRLEASY